MPGTKIMLTGAGGSVASALARRWTALRVPFVAVSRQASSSAVDWDAVWNGSALDKVGVIVHCAWSTVPAASERSPGVEWEQDLPLLRRLLVAAAHQRAHFVFLSSGGTVYGDAGDRPFVESAPCHPKGWYGASKRAAEVLIEQFTAREKLSATTLRVGNLYGFDVAEARPQGLIPHLVHAAREDRPIQIWGDGSALKDYLHQSDFADALDAVIERRPRGILNLGTGLSHQVAEVVKMVQTQLDRPIRIDHRPAAPWDVQRSLLDISKARAALGWKPIISLPDGVAQTIASIPPAR